jgi:hypothetical protein
MGGGETRSYRTSSRSVAPCARTSIATSTICRTRRCAHDHRCRSARDASTVLDIVQTELDSPNVIQSRRSDVSRVPL